MFGRGGRGDSFALRSIIFVGCGGIGERGDPFDRKSIIVCARIIRRFIFDEVLFCLDAEDFEILLIRGQLLIGRGKHGDSYFLRFYCFDSWIRLRGSQIRLDAEGAEGAEIHLR